MILLNDFVVLHAASGRFVGFLLLARDRFFQLLKERLLLSVFRFRGLKRIPSLSPVPH